MLVALHGFTENDCAWQDVLAGGGLEFSTPLLPGHGFKPCPNDLTINSLAKQLAERHLKPPADLLGYSMGGRLALLIALDHPAAVRRLVLISSGPGFTDLALQGHRRITEETMAQILEEDGLGPFISWWEKNPILAPAKPLPRSVEEDLRSRRLNHDPLGLAGALRRFGAGAMPNLWDRLPTLRQPTLLIAGAADRRYCEVMATMAKAIPNARLEVVADAGHAVHREQSAEVRRLVTEFLR